MAIVRNLVQHALNHAEISSVALTLPGILAQLFAENYAKKTLDDGSCLQI